AGHVGAGGVELGLVELDERAGDAGQTGVGEGGSAERDRPRADGPGAVDGPDDVGGRAAETEGCGGVVGRAAVDDLQRGRGVGLAGVQAEGGAVVSADGGVFCGDGAVESGAVVGGGAADGGVERVAPAGLTLGGRAAQGEVVEGDGERAGERIVVARIGDEQGALRGGERAGGEPDEAVVVLDDGAGGVARIPLGGVHAGADEVVEQGLGGGGGGGEQETGEDGGSEGATDGMVV